MPTNHREKFVKEFSQRLKKSLIQKGHASTRSESGVNYNKLAGIINCSKQMTRRYTLGEALPNYDIVLKMADWLEVSPGWLLFGDEPTDKKQINIDSELLRYILTNSAALFTSTSNPDETVNFILDLISDTMNLHEDRESIYKIIDLATGTARRFQKKNHAQHRKIAS